MLYFLLFLLIAAFAQMLGGAISWLFVRRFCNNLRLIVITEMLLMLAVSLSLIAWGLVITPFALAAMISGIFILFVLNKAIPHKHQTTNAERIGSLVFIAMCFHEFPEGIAAGASYLIDPYLGITMAITMALHNLPEGSIVAIPYFMKNKFKKGIMAISITQIAYVSGGLLAYFLLINISKQVQAVAMAFAAGAMLYIIGEEYLWIGKCPSQKGLADGSK